MLNYSQKSLPSNIICKGGTSNTDNLFDGIKIVLVLSLYHESGSSLFYEAYSRGIPVIAFDVGGNKEFLNEFKIDLFPKPLLKSNFNQKSSIENWNPSKLCERIEKLLNKKDEYEKHSTEVLEHYYGLDLKNKAIDEFNRIINDLESNQ